MPHVIIKLYEGKSEQQKIRISEQVTKAIVATTGSGESSVSVSIQDIEPRDWVQAVYKPDIIDNSDILYKRPGYNPL